MNLQKLKSPVLFSCDMIRREPQGLHRGPQSCLSAPHGLQQVSGTALLQQVGSHGCLQRQRCDNPV